MGFHDANPAGFGRGGGGAAVGAVVALFSKAAILSRREPGLGLGGGLELLSAMEERRQDSGLSN